MTEPSNRTISEAAQRRRESRVRSRAGYADRLRERLARIENGDDPYLDRYTSLRLDRSPIEIQNEDDLGAVIARLRKAQGATQQDLADALNVSQSTITDWERGKTRPRRRLFERITNILGEEIIPYLVNNSKLNANDEYAKSLVGALSSESFLSLSNSDRFSLFVVRLDYEMRSREIVFQPIDLAIAAFRIWSDVCSPASRILPEHIEDELIERLNDEIDWMEHAIRRQKAHAQDRSE